MEDPRYGFFYDVIAPRQLTEEDLPAIEKRMREIVDRDEKIRREMQSDPPDVLISDIREFFRSLPGKS